MSGTNELPLDVVVSQAVYYLGKDEVIRILRERIEQKEFEDRMWKLLESIKYTPPQT